MGSLFLFKLTMTLTTYDLDTDLSAVNAVLGSIGQSPVTTIEYENPEISFIVNLINEVSKDLQNEGWVFNTERNYPLTPNTDGEYIIPPNVLRMDFSDGQIFRDIDPIRREGKLYDRVSHNFKFSDRTFYFDIVWLFPFSDLPSVFQRYITSKASTRAAVQLVSNRELAAMLSQQEAFNRAACMEYECNQGDYTMFGTPPGVTYRSYQPYQSLNRIV